LTEGYAETDHQPRRRHRQQPDDGFPWPKNCPTIRDHFRSCQATRLGSIAFVKKSIYIAGSVKNADDLNAIRERPVKNDVPSNRKTSDAFFQFITSPANTGPLRQGQKLCVNLGNEKIGTIFAVLRYIVPNFNQI
jgi:hypothetical protein